MTDINKKPKFNNIKDKGNLEKFLACVQYQFDEARENFFTNTRYFTFFGEKGEYVVRAYCNEEMLNASMIFGWPCAFVWKQSQPINAAVWLKTPATNSYTLVAIWSFSPTADETSCFLLEGYGGDVFAGCGYDEDDVNTDVITHRDCDAAFNVSSGDQEVDAFHCPTLENISFELMEQFNIRIPRTDLSREEACAAHGARYFCRFCRAGRDSDDSEDDNEEDVGGDNMPRKKQAI